ncbi:MAG: NADH:flavin oxidoreductase [Deltaproteobacteria bacterium]|nr:NADH:flavin oxidoreductase [Deltaproteobacteria bacterium]
MPDLFDRTWIKSLELANRTVRSATWSGVGDERGYVTDLAVSFYSELGRGGIGLIVTGYQFVMTNGQQLVYMVGNYEDAQVEGLRRLAAAVHEQGGKIVPQIVHCGTRANPTFFREGDELWGPSAIPDPATGSTPHEVSREEITRLVEAYAAAARRSQEAGFDGVQLHGAHAYGINQFISGAWNQRGDAYGGSVKKRYRVLGEVLEAVRGAVGEDFPVLIKLSALDFLDGGLIPEEAAQIARWLEEDGIDAIEVSAGSATSRGDTSPSRKRIAKEEDEAYLVDLAAIVKRALKTPVITVGGIRSPKKINSLLADGKADYAALSRPFIREPHLVNRWKTGDTARATCISCNGCFETGLQGLGISCKVERELRAKNEDKD